MYFLSVFHFREFQKLLPLKFEIFNFCRLILRENKLDLKFDIDFRGLRFSTIQMI